MNSIRQVPAFQGLDGQLHLTEREALLGSIDTVLGRSRIGVKAAQLEPLLSFLLPLFAKLTDPRNQERSRRPITVGIEPPPQDMAFEGLSEVADQVNEFTDAAVEDKGASWGLRVDCDDLRAGQLVDCIDANDDATFRILITKITCDNEPAPVVVGHRIVGEDVAEEMVVPVDFIIRVVNQPEELFTLEDARIALIGLGEEELNNNLNDEEARKLHARRILLLTRIDNLEKGPNDAK